MSEQFKRIRACTRSLQTTEERGTEWEREEKYGTTDSQSDLMVIPCGTDWLYARTSTFVSSIHLLVAKSRSAGHLNNYQFYILLHNCHRHLLSLYTSIPIVPFLLDFDVHFYDSSVYTLQTIVGCIDLDYFIGHSNMLPTKWVKWPHLYFLFSASSLRASGLRLEHFL